MAGSEQGRGPPPSAPRPQEGSRVGSGFSTTRKRGLPAMPSTRDHAQHSRRSLTGGLFFAQTHSSELSVTLGRARWGAGRQAEEARGVCYSAGSPGVKTPFLQYGDTVTRLESLVYAHTLSTCRVAMGKPRSAPTVLLSIQCRGRSGSTKTRPGPAAEWVPHDAPTTEWSSGFKNHILGAFQQRTFFVR